MRQTQLNKLILRTHNSYKLQLPFAVQKFKQVVFGYQHYSQFFIHMNILKTTLPQMYNRSYFSPLLLAYLASDKLNCVHDASTDLPSGVFIGNLQAAQSIDTLKKHSIKAVLTVAAGTNLSYKKEPYIQQHLILLADDVPSFDMTKHFNTGIEFIQNCRKKGYNILVHCHAGISRSSTMVLAYLMKTTGWPLQKCLGQVRKRRPIIQPNPGFLKQLTNFQKRLVFDSQKKMNSSVKKQQSVSNKRPSSLLPQKTFDKIGQKGIKDYRQKQRLMQKELNDILINKGLKPKQDKRYQERQQKRQQKKQQKKQEKKQEKKPWGRDVFRSQPKINKTTKDPFRPNDIPLLPNRNKPNYHFTSKNFNQSDIRINPKDIIGTSNRGSSSIKYPSYRI